MSCAHRCTTGRGGTTQRELAQVVPVVVLRGVSVLQDKKVGAKGRRTLYDVATQHGQVVIISCRVSHGKSVKEYVAQLRMEYVRALERGPVIVVGDFNYDTRRCGAETEVDREVGLFVEEMALHDGSYSGAPDPSHYPAPEGSTASRIHAMYAAPRWFRGVTPGYMVGPEEMRDKKWHCPMMLTVEVKVGEPGDDEEEEQESDGEGASLATPVRWPKEEDDNKWQQLVQRVHVEMRQGSHVHRAMRKAANLCGSSRPVGERQTQPKLQLLVAKAEEETAGGS